MEQIQTINLPIQQSNQTKIVKHCQTCNASDKQLLRCTRCKKVYYCGVECQKKHWPTHKINCSKAKQNCNPETQKTTAQTSTATKSQPQNPFNGLNEFGKLIHLGSGNFSEIFKATSKKDGKTYAIKQVEKAKVQRIRKQADLFVEKHCLSKLKQCDYVIKLYRTFQDELNLFIQMECPENGELWQQAKTFGFFSEPIFKYYASHLVKAVSILHNDYEIIHRDLKPQNILLDSNNRIKLIDFGTAKDLSRPDIKGAGNGLKGKKPFQHYIGTPNYMAPECIHNKASQKKSDIYSLSGVFYFMKVGAPPFTGGSEFIVFKKTLETDMQLCKELFSAELRDLMLKMNNKSMQERFDINQVMAHEYFKGVDFNNLSNYEEALGKCREIQKILQEKGKQLYQKFHKVAVQAVAQHRKSIYDKEICPFLQSIKENLPQSLFVTKQQLEWLQERVEVMKIQAKAMMNYHDDNSTGFVEIFNNDFDSADRVIKTVKNSKSQDKDEERGDNQETIAQDVNLQKNNEKCEVLKQKQKAQEQACN